ncbi:MAG: shikimate kinase [Ginsengibacter sp.]
MPNRIFLVGFMGSGKSHWGRIWSEETGIAYYDLDLQIEKAYRISIADIFQKKGEEKFREIERLYLRRFDKKKNFLLACGGGTPCFADNLAWMKNHGIIIYLKATPEQIAQNLKNETSQRPLLKELSAAGLLTFIKSKLKERKVFYEAAHHILLVNKISEESLSLLLPN